MQPWKAWGNLDNITLEPLRTFYNVTLGTLREPLQYNLGNLGKLGNLQGTLQEPWGYLLETLREPWQSNLGNLIEETFTMSPWEPGTRLLGNLYIIILGTLTTFTWKTWEPCREPWRNLEGTFREPWGNLEEPWEPWGNLGNLYLGTWEPLLGNLGAFTWEPLLFYLGTFTWNLGTLGESVLEPWRNLEGTLRNLEGTLRNLGNLEGTLGTLGTFTWEPLLGNLGTFTWEPGNLYLGTWEPFTWQLGTFYLGTFTWEPLLGNLYLGTFTWEPLLGTWEPWGNRFWSCSGLLRNLYYGWRPQSILLLGNN